MRIGIIGYGKMGKLFAWEFSKKYEVGIYSNHAEESEFNLFDLIEELFKWADFIVIAKSTSETPLVLETLAKLSEKIKGKVIFDISTFKKDAIEVYKRFPEDIKVCSVHPMFGAGAKSFKGRRFIVIPVKGRDEDIIPVINLLREFKAEVFIADEKTHDEMMKIVIGIPYFIGISFLNFISEFEGIEKFGGTSFEYLTTYAKAVLNDSPEFIEEILEFSRDKIGEFLSFAEKGEFNIEMLRKKFEHEIEKSYTKFYRVLNK
ncbi:MULTISPECIES: prephenate dehydrogenase [Thermococcus]|uniref:Prephenate/arogenate dehydrogenase n=1 Tax=Thermococcus sibiricus TaxID=172049 RepID=A0A101EM68_9EURY|nr:MULTISPECIES: prephenate dehydrogenase [Thermococcus]KUK17939.1 MAG: Prephenate/arogenate dehydrogenase [Thermococcus sibiricus]KUK29320.1 MAG: Prephenate/arogenate dehydrogenase [Thermococcus sp. 40_45]MBC7094624.1 prephenate dehydrogenase [Thermococcus sp.]HII67898.1 prephenate dehydrogenase [Thermococcaceae archaeon]